MNKLRTRAMIKEAFDNLPGGVCYFDKRGVPILINRTMSKLVFSLTKRDLQSLSELDGIMRSPSEVFPGDGTVWRFQKKQIGDDGEVTEIIAADITEIYRRKRELEKQNEAQHDIMRRFETISKNVISIARTEEILSLKMRIHNELGYALSATRRFITSAHTAEEKEEYIEGQRKMAKMLLNETENDDEPDVFDEFKKSAAKLGMEITVDGTLPDAAEELITRAARECLVNAVRHARGDKVYIKASRDGSEFTAVITNNGDPPAGEISEGGGLSSLRVSVEKAGGIMTIQSVPVFSLAISLILPDEERSSDD